MSSFRMSMFIPLLAVTIAIVAPTAGARENDPDKARDLEIVGSAFGRVIDKVLYDADGPLPRDRFGRTRPRMRGLPPPRVILQREAYLLVRNVGTRKVESVEWSFVFYANAKREQVVGRHAFRSKETIKPGEMKFLSVTVKEAAPTSFDSVSILRIQFDDGTWATP